MKSKQLSLLDKSQVTGRKSAYHGSWIMDHAKKVKFEKEAREGHACHGTLLYFTSSF